MCVEGGFFFFKINKHDSTFIREMRAVHFKKKYELSKKIVLMISKVLKILVPSQPQIFGLILKANLKSDVLICMIVILSCVHIILDKNFLFKDTS